MRHPAPYQRTYNRCIEKAGNDEAISYVYDGGNVIAEYDGNGGLLCKYIYGPRVDEPVCMINVADSNAVSYYHFDGLGSVVALSDSYGNSVQSYEYSIFGQVAAEDPNHPNPYMFTGRRFDFETGLYYYRARYYNPYIGRFLQTDPVGYGAGMNLYAYCGNNPVGFVDPLGLYATRCPGHCEYPPLIDPNWSWTTGRLMVLPWTLDPKEVSTFSGLEEALKWIKMGMDWKGNIGLATRIWKAEYLEGLGDISNPVGTIIGVYIDVLEAFASRYGNVARTDFWRAYIEIQDWQWKTDKYGGQVVDEDGIAVWEKLGDPYWVEVCGLGGWDPAAAYETALDAYQAAAKGVEFWNCYQLGHPVPDGWWSDHPYMGLIALYQGCYFWKGDEVPEFTSPPNL